MSNPIDSIRYTSSLVGVSAENLTGGFFVHWPNPPSPENFLRMLHGSYAVELAQTTNGNVVGYINAISDGVMTAFIPQLEVLPKWQEQGIGSELVRRMLVRLDTLYAIDLMCEEDVIPFYERLGLLRAGGMIKRNYARQSCEP